ncbi:MAG: GGDEF domain-containing protein, partial [Candidatus Rifleibacteriota bacterium]
DEIKRARRFSFPLTLVMFVVDEFKLLSEKHGSRMGDAALYEIGRILKDSVRATDIPCRSGPEEFAVILAHTNAEQALIFSERLRERIASFKVVRGKEEASMTVSVGIAEYHQKIGKPSDLVTMVEKAMIKSQQKGGNLTTTENAEPEGQKP